MTNACPPEPTTGLEPCAGAELVAEVEAYLAAVAAFREEGCEPCWKPEDRPIRARVRVRRRR